MLLSENAKMTPMTVAKGIFSFIANYFVQIALLFLFIYIKYRSDYAKYMTDNLSVLLFTVGSMFLLFWIVYLYYMFENRMFLNEIKNIWLIYILMDICIVLFQVVDLLSGYARPMILFVLLTLFLVNYRETIFLNIVFSVEGFLMDIFLNYSTFTTTGADNKMFYSFIVCFIGGMFAIFLAKDVRTRLNVIYLAPVFALPQAVITTLLELTDYASFVLADYVAHILFGLLGAALSVAAFFLFLPIFEFLFKKLTVFRLHELTSPSAKLLNRLKKEAPGTFNHSMVVAQLAETCASELGENAELARACAYYHDVGKLRQPEFFTENQTDYNMHNELTPELSADIIRSHTKDGAKLLASYHLPQFFADVALQHHGTMPISYFYTKALRQSDGQIKIEDYSYPGPKPKSKIAVIIMVADACEAATRSLTNRTPENVEKTVRSIIQQRMDLEQFADCDITMAELQTIKNSLVAALTGVYHHRIKYPDVRFTRSGNVEDKGESKDAK